MKILDKIFGNAGINILDTGSKLIDTLSTSDDEKSKAKKELSEVVLSNLSTLASYQRDVLTEEMRGSFLQKNWRPIVMLFFVVLLAAKWFGYTSDVSSDMELRLMDIIEIGLGGYIAGRSLEKISETVTKNVDLPFVKKKDRTA